MSWLVVLDLLVCFMLSEFPGIIA